MSDNFKSDRHSRMDYEMILRGMAELMTGDDPGQGGLYGFADAAFGTHLEIMMNFMKI